MLSELVPVKGVQSDMFSLVHTSPKSAKLMRAMDAINKKIGKESIKLASEGFTKPWKMKQENKSPSYTTDWENLMKVS